MASTQHYGHINVNNYLYNLDHDGDGTNDLLQAVRVYQERIEMLNASTLEGASVGGLNKSEIRALDADADGSISKAELESMLNNLDEAIRLVENGKIGQLCKLDFDGDGVHDTGDLRIMDTIGRQFLKNNEDAYISREDRLAQLQAERPEVYNQLQNLMAGVDPESKAGKRLINRFLRQSMLLRKNGEYRFDPVEMGAKEIEFKAQFDKSVMYANYFAGTEFHNKEEKTDAEKATQELAKFLLEQEALEIADSFGVVRHQLQVEKQMDKLKAQFGLGDSQMTAVLAQAESISDAIVAHFINIGSSGRGNGDGAGRGSVGGRDSRSGRPGRGSRGGLTEGRSSTR